MVVRITSLKPGLRILPLSSVHDAACIRVLKTSKGKVTCICQLFRGAVSRTREWNSELTSHAVTPAKPPAAINSAHVKPELNSASASSIKESWCLCLCVDVGGGGGGFKDLKKRQVASYLRIEVSVVPRASR